MQGLVNFAQQIAMIVAVLLPTAFYCSAIGLFLFAAWGFWQQAQPHNPFRGKPWIPLLSMVMSGACASFPVILNKVNASAGSAVTVSLASDLTGYTDSSATSILGSTPGDAVLNIVQAFQGFFQVFGAMACFLAMLAWRATVNGRSNRPWSASGVQFVFGVMLMNVSTLAQWLVGLFTTSST
jgi:hypothetical protein